MKLYDCNITSYKKNASVKKMGCINNSGSTMIETLVSFAVLVIVFAALFGMIRFSSNLRMRAVDTAEVSQSFNGEVYKRSGMNDVDVYAYTGWHAADNTSMFNLRLDTEKTKQGNVDTTSNVAPADKGESVSKSTTLTMKYDKSIKLINIDATGYVSVDSRIKSEHIATPKMLLFRYNKEPKTLVVTP